MPDTHSGPRHQALETQPHDMMTQMFISGSPPLYPNNGWQELVEPDQADERLLIELQRQTADKDQKQSNLWSKSNLRKTTNENLPEEETKGHSSAIRTGTSLPFYASKKETGTTNRYEDYIVSYLYNFLDILIGFLNHG